MEPWPKVYVLPNVRISLKVSNCIFHSAMNKLKHEVVIFTFRTFDRGATKSLVGYSAQHWSEVSRRNSCTTVKNSDLELLTIVWLKQFPKNWWVIWNTNGRKFWGETIAPWSKVLIWNFRLECDWMPSLSVLLYAVRIESSDSELSTVVWRKEFKKNLEGYSMHHWSKVPRGKYRYCLYTTFGCTVVESLFSHTMVESSKSEPFHYGTTISLRNFWTVSVWGNPPGF